MKLEPTQLAVVGAGPAARAAGETAARLGVAVTLIDQQEIEPELEGVQILELTTAWGLFDETTIALSGAQGSGLLRAGAIVLATGARDRPLAFPGWTLPGVGPLDELSPQRGDRILVAGIGPRLAEAAEGLPDAGVVVAGIVEAALPEAAVVFAAEGDDRVGAALVAPLGSDGLPDRARLERIEVDLIGLCYGRDPAVELLRQAGGEVAYVEDAAAWLPVRDAFLRAGPGVFAAGAAGGFEGGDVAVAEGRLAGTAVAWELGALPAGRAQAMLEELRLELEETLAAPRARARRDGPLLSPLACLTPETLVCRCERVTAAWLADALDDGARTLHELRAFTRLGMGVCQGRLCGRTAEAMLRERLGPGAPAPEPLSVRPPVRPVPLSALAALGAGSGAQR